MRTPGMKTSVSARGAKGIAEPAEARAGAKTKASAQAARPSAAKKKTARSQVAGGAAERADRLERDGRDSRAKARAASGGTAPAQGRRVTHAEAFCVYPEHKAAEWLAAAGGMPTGKDEHAPLLSEAIGEAWNKLYQRIKGDAELTRIADTFMWHPEDLRHLTIPVAVLSGENLHYFRLGAASAFFRLHLDAEAIVRESSSVSKDRAPMSWVSDSEVQEWNAAAAKLEKAICAFSGVRTVWEATLGPRELLTLVTLEHSPTSKEAALLAAINGLIDVQARLGQAGDDLRSGNHVSIARALKCVCDVKAQLAFAERFEAAYLARTKKSR